MTKKDILFVLNIITDIEKKVPIESVWVSSERQPSYNFMHTTDSYFERADTNALYLYMKNPN